MVGGGGAFYMMAKYLPNMNYNYNLIGIQMFLALKTKYFGIQRILKKQKQKKTKTKQSNNAIPGNLLGY